MSRKVFISFLGTNNYIRTHYIINGKISKPVRFIQEALIDEFCNDWDENDRIFIFYTQESLNRYWIDKGQKYDEKTPEEDTYGLEHILKEKAVCDIVHPILIPEGFTENDIWKIFECLYNILEEKDIIYFDATHAFRSIPLLATVLFNYAKCLKNITVASISYGAFETLGPAFKVQNMDIKDRKAPVIDISSIIHLQDIINAANDYIKFGKIGRIGDVLSFSGKETKAQRRTNEAIKIIQRELNNLDSYISICDIQHIKQGTFAKNIQEQFDTAINGENINAAEKELLKKIEPELFRFKPSASNLNIEMAIERAFKHNMLVQAYTLAQEYIISITCEQLTEHLASFRTSFESEKDRRTFTSSLLAISNSDVATENFTGILSKNIRLTKQLLNWPKRQQIHQQYKQLTNNRNSLNHAKGAYDERTIIHQFSKTYPDIIQILTEQRPTL